MDNNLVIATHRIDIQSVRELNSRTTEGKVLREFGGYSEIVNKVKSAFPPSAPSGPLERAPQSALVTYDVIPPGEGLRLKIRLYQPLTAHPTRDKGYKEAITIEEVGELRDEALGRYREQFSQFDVVDKGSGVRCESLDVSTVPEKVAYIVNN